jgi:hypothetical protein
VPTIHTEEHQPTHDYSEHETVKRKRSQSSPASHYRNIGQSIYMNGKKKIIPVQSDFESSPSPEYPSSPIASPPVYQKKRIQMSKSTVNLAMQEDKEVKCYPVQASVF